MNIQSEIERLRNIMLVLNDWDKIIKQRKLDVILGHSEGFSNIRVQTTRKNDKMEKAVIDYIQIEERRKDLLHQYMIESEQLKETIRKYCDDPHDMQVLVYYMMGCKYEEIPMKGKSKCGHGTVQRAMRNIQKAIDEDIIG